MNEHVLNIDIDRKEVQLILDEVKTGVSAVFLNNYILSNKSKLEIPLKDLIQVIRNMNVVINRTSIDEVEIELERISSDILESAIEDYHENYLGDKIQLDKLISQLCLTSMIIEDDKEEYFEEE